MGDACLDVQTLRPCSPGPCPHVSPRTCPILPGMHELIFMTPLLLQDNDRVDIGKWTAENPTGGYLFAFENDNIKPDDTPVGPIPGMEDPFVLR